MGLFKILGGDPVNETGSAQMVKVRYLSLPVYGGANSP